MRVSSLILLAPAVLAAELDARASTPAAFASSSDGVYKLSGWSAPVRGNGSPNGASTWKLSVDDTNSGRKQTVRGFGAAVTDSTVAVFNKLPAAQLTKLLNELLTTQGANFGLLRHTIAASDLSADPVYTYDDNGGNVDTGFSGFNLGDRGTAMAKLLARMKSIRSDMTLLGSPWVPPAWMQLDKTLIAGTVNNNLDHTYEKSFGQYFVKYLQAFKNLGAPVDAITIQNEPLNSQTGHPTMYIYADESGKLIQNTVGPALRSAGLNTGVWAYDHNTDHPEYPNTVLSIASQYVNTVAWHCYAPNNNWGVLSDFHNSHPNVEQVMTECWTSSRDTAWNQASGFTMGPLQNWATGSVAWVLGTDTSDGPHISTGGCDTCRGLVVVDTNAGTYKYTVDYYMMAQFSKFIPKGASILSGSGSWTYGDGTGLESVASLNPDGTRTVVIENKFGNDVYVTLDTNSGETWSGLIHAKSVVTWLLPAH